MIYIDILIKGFFIICIYYTLSFYSLIVKQRQINLCLIDLNLIAQSDCFPIPFYSYHFIIFTWLALLICFFKPANAMVLNWGRFHQTQLPNQFFPETIKKRELLQFSKCFIFFFNNFSLNHCRYRDTALILYIAKKVILKGDILRATWSNYTPSY